MIEIKILKIIDIPLTNLAYENFDSIYKHGGFMEVRFITKDEMILRIFLLITQIDKIRQFF